MKNKIKCTCKNGNACANYNKGICLSWTGPCLTPEEYQVLNDIETDKQEQVIFINKA
jgi:hypothetical protein